MSHDPDPKNTMPLDLSRATPPLVVGNERTLADQLAAWVRLRIDEHALKPGTRLPSIRRFADEKQVSRSTVVDAYDKLIAAGYIESRRGSGFYVRARRANLAPARRSGATTGIAATDAQSIDVIWLLRSMLRQAPATDQPGAGLLPPTWLDSDLVGAAVRAVGRETGDAVLGYGVPEGHLPLRQALSQRLAQLDIGAAPEQIVTTHGVTHGIDLVARHYLAPGDTVFVEDPAWFLMFGRFAAFGVRLVGVPRRTDGPDLGVLANLLTRYQPKLFVVGSVLHNPTGTSITAANAHRLLRLADEYGFTIVEDDIYGDLHYASRRPPSMRAFDEAGLVISCGSVSKTIALGYRIGWAVTPAFHTDISRAKFYSSVACATLQQRVLARYYASGGYDRYLRGVRASLAANSQCFIDSIARHFPDGTRVTRPAGGLVLWVELPRNVDGAELFKTALASRIGIAPGLVFSAKAEYRNYIRLSCGLPWSATIERALEKLGRLVTTMARGG